MSVVDEEFPWVGVSLLLLLLLAVGGAAAGIFGIVSIGIGKS